MVDPAVNGKLQQDAGNDQAHAAANALSAHGSNKYYSTVSHRRFRVFMLLITDEGLLFEMLLSKHLLPPANGLIHPEP